MRFECKELATNALLRHVLDTTFTTTRRNRTSRPTPVRTGKCEAIQLTTEYALVNAYSKYSEMLDNGASTPPFRGP